MKKPIVLMAAVALSFGVRAQSLDEGVKMVKYERYESASKILQPLAGSNPTANYYLGLTQLGQDNKDAARATFAKFPDDPANMAGMARLNFMSKNLGEGQRLADAVVAKAKKKDWQPYLYAADAINYGGGDPYKAIELYKKALERADNIDIRIGLGDAYLKLQSGGGEAMNNYENAITKDPKNSLGQSRIGALWYAARNYKDALAAYSKAKDADPNNPIPYRDLANAYFYSGNYTLARQNIEKYLELSDKSCDDQIMYANILFLGKDYPAAISKMQEVIGTCNTRPYMYRVLGYSQYETKDYANSMQNMRTFFSKQDPTKQNAFIADDYLYYGFLFGQQKQADSAEFYFNKGLSMDTSAAGAKNYIKIAESYKAMNSDAGYKKAAEYYGKAIQAAGDKAVAIDYFWWGAMNYYGKNYSEAARIFEQMETKFPDQPSATYWRGRVASAVDNEGKTGTAIPYFDKWLGIVGPSYDKKNDLVTAYRYYAIYYYNKENKAKAQEYLDKIKAINPNDELYIQLTDLMKKPAKAPAAPKTPAPKPGKK